MELHGHVFDKYKDPDGDEEAAKQIPKLRRERHKALKLHLAANPPTVAATTAAASKKSKTAAAAKSDAPAKKSATAKDKKK